MSTSTNSCLLRCRHSIPYFQSVSSVPFSQVIKQVERNCWQFLIPLHIIDAQRKRWKITLSDWYHSVHNKDTKYKTVSELGKNRAHEELEKHSEIVGRPKKKWCHQERTPDAKRNKKVSSACSFFGRVLIHGTGSVRGEKKSDRDNCINYKQTHLARGSKKGTRAPSWRS